MREADKQRGRGRPVYAIQQQIVAFNTERTRRKQAYQTHAQAIEDLLTTKLRLCQNASHKMSLTAAANMKLRYALMMYTRAKTLSQQELDPQQDQACGQLVVGAALAKTTGGGGRVRQDETQQLLEQQEQKKQQPESRKSRHT